MKIRSLFLTLFLSFCFSANAQVDVFQEEIIDFLNNNETRKQYTDAYDSMFDLLKSQFAVSNVPEDVWTDLKKNKEKSLDEIVNLLSFAYRKHFTREDINAMSIFYTSDAGKQMMSDPSVLSESQNKEISTFMNGTLGKKIDEKREDLTTDVAKISEFWSRDLFSESMSALVKKGYYTEH